MGSGFQSIALMSVSLELRHPPSKLSTVCTELWTAGRDRRRRAARRRGVREGLDHGTGKSTWAPTRQSSRLRKEIHQTGEKLVGPIIIVSIFEEDSGSEWCHQRLPLWRRFRQWVDDCKLKKRSYPGVHKAWGVVRVWKKTSRKLSCPISPLALLNIGLYRPQAVGSNGGRSILKSHGSLVKLSINRK